MERGGWKGVSETPLKKPLVLAFLSEVAHSIKPMSTWHTWELEKEL